MSDTNLLTRTIPPSTSKAESKHTKNESEYVLKKIIPNMNPYLDSNNNSDKDFLNKVKTEIKTEPDDSDSQADDTYNYSSSELLPDVSSKQKYLFLNPVPAKLDTEIKKEPLHEVSDLINLSNKTKCGSPEYFDGITDNKELDKDIYDSRNREKTFEEYVSIYNLEKKLKKIKSEPNELIFRTQTNSIKCKNQSKVKANEQTFNSDKENEDPNEISFKRQTKPIKCKNQSKLKGAVALRERLLMYNSEIKIKQEPLEINECKEFNEQMVLKTKSANIPEFSEPNITPQLNSNNNSDMQFADKTKTEIKIKPEYSVSQACIIYNYSSSSLLPGLSSNQKYMPLDAVTEKLPSGVKKEPVDEIFDLINIDDKVVCGSPENFNRERHTVSTGKHGIFSYKELDNEHCNSRNRDKPYEENVYGSDLEKRLKTIKSEPNEIIYRTQNNPIKCKKSGKLKGAVALRERLIMFTSKIQTKQEPLEINEFKEATNDHLCNPDKENEDPKTLLFNTKLEATKANKRNDSHRKIQSVEVGDTILSPSSQNGIVDGTSYTSSSDYNIVLNCHGNLSPLLMKQFALKRSINVKQEPLELNERSSSNSEIQTKGVCGNILPCHVKSGIVVRYFDFNSEYFFVKNWFADLVPIRLPGPPYKICALSVVMGSCIYSQTLICLERFVFLNETAIQCKYINVPTKVQFDGIWNRKEGNFIAFVIWNGNKPSINGNHPFTIPEATDYFDIAGKCTSFDNRLKIHIDKYDFTLHCSSIVSSFLNYDNKIIFIPDDTPVDLYLRKFNSPKIEPKWYILWMVLYL